MFITVLIATCNRADSLARTIESLFSVSNLAQPDWEILIVDNNSTDHTLEVCRGFQARYPERLRWLVEKRPGKSQALNLGLEAAQGELLALTDDDVTCGPDYIRNTREFFERYPVEGAQGRVIMVYEGGRPPWMFAGLEQLLSSRDYGEEPKDWDDHLCGCNMVLRREVFQRAGGFCSLVGPGTSIMACDTEFSLRVRQAGARLMYAPQMAVWHHMPRARLTKPFARERFFRNGRFHALYRPLDAPLWRFALYVAKDALASQARAFWHLLHKRPDEALRLQCRTSQRAGFLWQHWLLRQARRRGQPGLSPSN